MVAVQDSNLVAPEVLRLTKWSTTYMPYVLREDSTGLVWFSLVLSKQLARFNPATRQLRLYSHPINSGNLWWIEMDSQDRVWYVTSYASGQDAVGYFNPATESFTEWTSSDFVGLFGLYVDSSTGEVWFTGRGTQPSIFRLVPNLVANPVSGDFTRWKIGSYNFTQDITKDGNGKIWVTAPWIDYSLLRLDPQVQSSQLTAWQLANENHPPFMIAPALDGTLWFTEHDPVGNSLANFNPGSNTLVEYSLPQASSYPSGLVPGTEQVWVNAAAASQVAVLDLPASGSQSQLSPVTSNAQVSNFSLNTTTTAAANLPFVQLDAPTFNLSPAQLEGSYYTYGYPTNNCEDPFGDPYPFTISPSSDGGYWMSSCSYLIKLDQPFKIFLPITIQ